MLHRQRVGCLLGALYRGRKSARLREAFGKAFKLHSNMVTIELHPGTQFEFGDPILDSGNCRADLSDADASHCARSHATKVRRQTVHAEGLRGSSTLIAKIRVSIKKGDRRQIYSRSWIRKPMCLIANLGMSTMQIKYRVATHVLDRKSVV